MEMDTDTVVLVNKTLITFLAVITAGILLSGSGVIASSGTVLTRDEGVLVGPEVVESSLEVDEDVKVTTSEKYGSWIVDKGETLQVDMYWEEVPDVLTTNEFNITVYRNGEIATKDSGVNGTGTPEGRGTLDPPWNFTETTSSSADYSVSIEGLQGATNYTIQIKQIT